jgi:hypothetical protein
MAQHSNYAQDRDLMMEAYGSVRGIVPRTSSTAMPRGYVLTEAHCDEEKLDSIELGGKLYELGNDDPNDDGIVIQIEKHPNGYFITGGVYSEPEDYVNDPENPREGYGYALSLDGQPMDEDDLEEDGEHEDGEHASDEEHGEDTVKVELELDQDLAAKLHAQLMDEVVPAEDSSCNAEHEEHAHEDAEGHHSSGSDDGECDECGGDGCDVCNGTGENEEHGFDANKSDLDDDGNISKYERSRGEAFAAAMKKEDGE